MRDYTVLEALKRTAASKIENAFERGYEQGYNDCKVEQTEEEAQSHYNAGYEDGTKAKDGERGSIYYGGYGDGLKDGYEKGLKHGQELRVKETECAETCGMKRAWEAARKIIDMWFNYFRHDPNIFNNFFELNGRWGDDVFELFFKKYSAEKAIKKIEEYEIKRRGIDSAPPTVEEKQDASEDDVKVGDMVRTLKDHDECDIKVFSIGTIGKVYEIKLTSDYPYKVVANGDYWWYSRDMFEVIKEDTPENVDSIEVGDECICNCPNKQKVIVTAVLEYEHHESWVTIMRKDGACYSRSSNGLTKTGKHYDIQSILDKMKEHEVEE